MNTTPATLIETATTVWTGVQEDNMAGRLTEACHPTAVERLAARLFEEYGAQPTREAVAALTAAWEEADKHFEEACSSLRAIGTREARYAHIDLAGARHALRPAVAEVVAEARARWEDALWEELEAEGVPL